jgi:flagellar M-ring protein FliF
MARIDTRSLQRNVKQAFDGFTTGQKAMLGLATGAVVVGLFAFTQMTGSGADRVPLYANLDASDASEIAAALDAQGVSYDISDGGTTLLVPEDQVYRLRMDFAAEGLPTGGNEGYELMDNMGITSGQMQQRVGYQRALQGELARTIEAIDAVKVARVNLVIPSDDVFAGDDQMATASVLIEARGNERLSNEQVEAIVNLVANAVPELSPSQVTVADSTGRSLWTGAPEMGAGSGEQEEIRAGYEGRLQNEIESMLAIVYGPGNVRVKVNADLDFTQQSSIGVQQSVPTTADGEAAATRVTELIERYTGAGATAVGIVGPDGLPLPDNAAGDGTDYENTSRDTIYAINEVTTEVIQAGGQVLRLNVAAVVNSDVVTADQTGPVTELISTAAGVSAERGDVINVQALPFDTSAAEAAQDALDAEAAAANRMSTEQILQALLALLLVAFVLFFAWRSIRKAQKRTAVEPIDVRELEMVREQIQAILPDEQQMLDGGTQTLALPSADRDENDELLVPAIELSDAARAAEIIEAELVRLIDNDPESAASVVRLWLGDRRLAVAKK